MKNTHEIHLEKKEIVILFLMIGFLTNGITMIVGIFLAFWIVYRIVNRFSKHEDIEFLNTDFVN
jgi:hypothetical protein